MVTLGRDIGMDSPFNSQQLIPLNLSVKSSLQFNNDKDRIKCQSFGTMIRMKTMMMQLMAGCLIISSGFL